MTEFLFLFRGGESGKMDGQQSSEDWQAYMQKWMQWMQGLTDQGLFVSSEPLRDAGKVVSNKGNVITDGPFTEGKEIVGGYLICKAESLEEAVEFSKGCPIFDYEDGTVEVREINK